MPSRLDALRALYDTAQRTNHLLIPHGNYTRCTAALYDAFPALLAVVEAARDYRRNSIVLIGMESVGTALDTALAALTTEEE